MADDEGVVLVEEGDVGREGVHEQRLPAVVVVLRGSEAEAGEDAAGVGVDDEDGLAGGVEDDVVGRLRPDAVGGEEGRPQLGDGEGEETLQPALESARAASRRSAFSFGGPWR